MFTDITEQVFSQRHNQKSFWRGQACAEKGTVDIEYGAFSVKEKKASRRFIDVVDGVHAEGLCDGKMLRMGLDGDR